MTKKTESNASLRAASIAFCALACGACGSSAPPAPVGVSDVAPSSNARVDFAYDSLDERPVSSAATRGKPTLVTFVQTGSVWGQAQVGYLVAMARNDGDRVNYALIALEPRQSRELVEQYAKSLGVTFPVAMGDQATLVGAGPFGEVKVPTTVLLDRVGRVVFRADGRVAKSDELRAHMRSM